MKFCCARSSLAPLLVVLVSACANPSEVDGGQPDASGPALDASTSIDAAPADAAEVDARPDSGQVDANEADADPVDAGEADANAIDGGQDGGDVGCPVPPSLVDGPFAPGPAPGSANLLLTDTAANTIYQLSLDGTVLDQWPSPASRTFGVAHDLRNPGGFWVIGRDVTNMPNVFRLSSTGTVTASFGIYAPNGTLWGIDFALGSSPALDLLVYTNLNTNGLPAVSGTFIDTGARAFEAWMMQPASAQWYGTHVQRYACDDAATLVYWTTRADTLELREWPASAATRSLTVPGTNDARGVSRTPRGDFYVVDNQNDLVLHLSDTAALLDSFATPSGTPADLSYAE